MSSRSLLCLLFGAGTAVYFVLPIWAGLFAEAFGLTALQIGWLLSADMSANAAATLLARLWLHRVHLRLATMAGLALFVGGNLACIGVTDFAVLLPLRYLVGLGMGTLVAISVAGIGASSRPDRNFGFALTVQVTIGGGLLLLTPVLVRLGGIAAYYVALSIIMSFVLLFLRRLPARFAKQSAPRAASSRGLNPPLVLAFGGVVLFFVGMNCFWSFAERLADQQGIAADFVSFALAVSVMVSALGSLLAAWMSDRYGRIGPISAGLLLAMAAVSLLLFEPSAAGFFLSINAFNWMYNFVIPFQNGWIADLDTTGRNIVVLPAVQGGSISLAPLVAGTLVSGSNYTPVLFLSVSFLFASALAFRLLRFLISDRTKAIRAHLNTPKEAM